MAPRKEKPPDIEGELLEKMDMKKFRQERGGVIIKDINEFEMDCIGSFSQDKKLPNSIIIPGKITIVLGLKKISVLFALSLRSVISI